MEELALFGFFASLLIGISLGLIGSGGSILTVPILVYLFQIKPELATAYSLAIVGIASLVGSIQNIRNNLVHWKTTIVFAIPAMLGVYLARKFLMPALPDALFNLSTFVVTKNLAIMLLFSVLMISAAISMIRGRKDTEAKKELTFHYPMIACEGILVGTITGIVGAGGGFLIIPALVILVGLPMKMAVGTSLVIIAVKSLIGFLGDVGNPEIDYQLLSIISLISIVGIIFGNFLRRYISNEKLKPAFGYFVLLMGVYIIGKELF